MICARGVKMTAVQSGAPNGLGLDDPPTPDGLDSGVNGGADSEAEGDLFGSDEEAENDK